MSVEPYALTIRARDGAPFRAGPELVGERLGRIPGTSNPAPGHFTFGAVDEHGQMEFVVDETIGIRIPRPWIRERGPQVFALVFMVAEWCQGEVFDPQINDILQKEVVLQGMVTVREAQREQEQREQEQKTAPEVPAPQSDAPARPKRPWWKPGA